MDPLSRTEALVGVAFCAAFADGTVGSEEDERLEDHLAECHALRHADDATLHAALEKVERILRKEGDDALLERAATALPPPLRETAFCLAADLVLADGEIHAEERAFIERLRTRLGVEDTLGSKIVEVLLIRNKA